MTVGTLDRPERRSAVRVRVAHAPVVRARETDLLIAVGSVSAAAGLAILGLVAKTLLGL